MEGGGQVSLDAPLEPIPLLVRAGTILPMGSDEKLILHLYPPVEGVKAALMAMRGMAMHNGGSIASGWCATRMD